MSQGDLGLSIPFSVMSHFAHIPGFTELFVEYSSKLGAHQDKEGQIHLR